MNVRTIAFVASRLLAIYLLIYHGIVQLGMLMLGTAMFDRHDYWVSLFSGLVSFGLYLLAAACLWYRAGWISGRLTQSLPEQIDIKVEQDGWQALVVSAIGWICLMHAVNLCEKVLSPGLFIQQYSEAAIDVLTLAMRGGALYAIAALMLVLFPGKIVSGLNAVRNWSKKSQTKEDLP